MSEQSTDTGYLDGKMETTSSVEEDGSVTISLEWTEWGARGEFRMGLEDLRTLRDEMNKHLVPGIMAQWLWEMCILLEDGESTVSWNAREKVCNKLEELLGENWADICREAFAT